MRRHLMLGLLALTLTLTTTSCELVQREPAGGVGEAGAAAGSEAAAASGAPGLEAVLPEGVRPLAPYSPGIRAGGFVHLAGQIGRVPSTGALAEGGTAAELEQATRNMGAILTEAGATVADLVSCTLYLVDINDYVVVNEVWASFVADPPPARTTVAVAALPAGASVEVSCIARDPTSSR